MADNKNDKINPTAKLPVATAANGGAKPKPNAPPRPMYRPKQPTRRRSRSGRSCLCCCCLWITFLIITLLLLAAVAGAVFWLIYRPHRPEFTLDSLTLQTASPSLASKFALEMRAHNSNGKVTFLYGPTITVSVISGDSVIGTGTVPGFVHHTSNTTLLKANVGAAGLAVASDQIEVIKSAIKSKSRFPVTVTLDTKVEVKAGFMKTKRVGIRVRCDDIRLAAPTNKVPGKAVVPNDKCEVDLRIKIWKWSF